MIFNRKKYIFDRGIFTYLNINKPESFVAWDKLSQNYKPERQLKTSCNEHSHPRTEPALNLLVLQNLYQASLIFIDEICAIFPGITVQVIHY